jgi:hypothetical protein
MKRIVIALFIAVVAVAAFAQEPPHPGGFKRHMGPGGDEMVAALALSADQKTQWDAIHQQLEASVRPLFLQHRVAEDQLQVLVEASNPDPTAVGKQFLAMRALDKQIQAAHESTKAKIDAILSPDQKAKLEGLHRKMEGGPEMMRMPMHHPGSPRQ